ncbi:Hpt domain-containing protein [Vibrio scophthalmi]|uniref:Hpt domain-containing protein n=1 Tax=Vibrio scophthalmi TaxID=45658 RepID=UPI002284BB45|nr:Hpt domain-containing protein [Vibrio scophthalmi]MCY9802156.1 Hpt domain-containing protein [Vibrio scophthalmi]
MQKRQLMLGWGLILIWAIALTALVVNYHKTEAKMVKVAQLGDSIEEFRSRLFFDAPYRVNLVEQQASNLNKIEQLHQQLSQASAKEWFNPDVQQLLFTTEWFVEQSHAFINTELALVDLITQVQAKRLAYAEQSDLESYYFRLSAYVFEALFSDASQASVAYRDLDNLYTQSLSLAAEDKQQLQAILANTSQVMGSYAQGSYLVSQLVSHSVHNEVTAIGDQYHLLLEKHLIIGALLSGCVMLLLMALWYRSFTLFVAQIAAATSLHSQTESQTQASPDQVSPQKQQTESMTSPQLEEQAHYIANKQERANIVNFVGNNGELEPQSISQSDPTEVESQINFPLMLDSLGDDRESLCMLLEVFVEDHQRDVAEITRLLSDAPEEAIRKAHSLKGVGGNLGADRLRDIAGKLEEAIQKDSTQVAELLVTLDVYLSQAIKEAKGFLTEEA